MSEDKANDKELAAIATCVAALDGLEVSETLRVLAYLSAREHVPQASEMLYAMAGASRDLERHQARKHAMRRPGSQDWAGA